METHAYSEDLLPPAMRNLAVMMECGVNMYGIEPEMFYLRFLSSGVADGLGRGNPKYAIGLSGIELADEVIVLTGGKILPNTPPTYSVTPEFWAGWSLAYYQWKTGFTFAFLQRNGLDINTVLDLYHPLHEAGLEKFADTADHLISEHRRQSVSPIKAARERIGLTQKDLSKISSVSLRMIRAYEQGSQDISSANFSTVLRLMQTLNLTLTDLT